MTTKEKALYWFLLIITLGLISIYWKTKRVSVKDELSKKEKITINLNKLISLLGGKENIKSVESTNTKIKVNYINRDNIQIEDIKNINGVSGVFATSSYVQIIVGKEAQAIERKMNFI